MKESLVSEEAGTVIDMETLPHRHTRLTRNFAEYALDAFLVSMDDQSHVSPVELPTALPEGRRQDFLAWMQAVGESHWATHADEKRRSEYAAMAVSLALVDILYDKEALRLSKTGDRIDIYLTDRNEDRLIFNNAERLEISGIRKKSRTNTPEKRLQEKVDRLSKFGGPPIDERTLVCVVEFSEPRAMVAKV